MIKSDLSTAPTAVPESTVNADIATTTTTPTNVTITVAIASARASDESHTAASSEKVANPQNQNIGLAPLVKASFSTEANTLTDDITHLLRVPQEKILAVATELNAFTKNELKITQALYSHLGQERVLFDNLVHETGLSCKQISKVVHALKHFEILNVRQSVLRFVKQADPQLSLSDPLDCFGSHRSIRLGCAEQCIVGGAISMVESQVFYLLKQRKVVQPSDFIYFVNNPANRRAFFRFLVWSRLFHKVFMDDKQLLHFIPKYKAPKAVPNLSHTCIPVVSDSNSSSDNSIGNSSSSQGSVASSSSTAAQTATATTTPASADIKSAFTEADDIKADATRVSTATAKPSLCAKAEALLFPCADTDDEEASADESADSIFAAPDDHHGITIIVNPQHHSTVPPAKHTINDLTTVIAVASDTTPASVSLAPTVSTTTASDLAANNNSSLVPTASQNQADIESDDIESGFIEADAAQVSAATAKLNLRAKAEALLFPCADTDDEEAASDEDADSIFAAPDPHHGITIIVNPQHHSTVPQASHAINDSTTLESTDVTLPANTNNTSALPVSMFVPRLATQPQVETAISAQSTDSTSATTTSTLKATPLHSSPKQSLGQQRNSLSFMNNNHSLKKVTKSPSYCEQLGTNLSYQH